jgi:isopenicillin N synthase-like dioxygenase
MRTFALALALPESYFDPMITHPGAGCSLNYYPGRNTTEKAEVENTGADDVGLGSHTDNRVFTLLWQDAVGGLVVLNRQGQWITVTPIPGTFVVNIADLLMRMRNDRWMSTVHRVEVNRSASARVSMPFFFGNCALCQPPCVPAPV